MSIENVQLNKLLKFLSCNDRVLISELRKDIRGDINRLHREDGKGADFYRPFWADAKTFAAGEGCLVEMTDKRIRDNQRRAKLYSLLRDGFLQWWNSRRRWTNMSFEFMPNRIVGQKKFLHSQLNIRIDGLMALELEDGSYRLIYPYMSKQAVMRPDIARIGLWLMQEILSKQSIVEMRILDVLDSTSYSARDHPLLGDEERHLDQMFQNIRLQRERLLPEYS